MLDRNEDWSALLAADTDCLANPDIGVRLPTLDTSLYLVILLWTLSIVELEPLQVPFCCGVNGFESDPMPAEFSSISRPPCRGG